VLFVKLSCLRGYPGARDQDEPRRDKDINETLDHVLAALHQRKSELAQLAVSETSNQLHLVLQAGLTMATRGVLLMQSALQQRDDRAAALGAKQYNEGMKYMAQRARLQSA